MEEIGSGAGEEQRAEAASEASPVSETETPASGTPDSSLSSNAVELIEPRESAASADPSYETPHEKLPGKKRRGRLARWLLWIGAVLLVLLLALGIAVAILLHRAEPLLRASLINTIQERFHAHAELDDLRVSVLDGFWIEGRGLRIWLPPENTQPVDPQAQQPSGHGSMPQQAQQAQLHTEPWIVVNNFKFHVSWHYRPGQPIEISVIHVEGARVLLPPKEDRPHLSMSGTNQASGSGQTGQSATGAGTASPSQAPAQQKSSHSGLFKMPEVNVQRVECNQAELVIELTQDPGKPPREPLDFQLEKITLIPDSRGGPIAFSVDMVNAKPIGTIHSTGHFGPWVTGDPGSLPVSGDFSFNDADLGTIKGIAGILSSTGHYEGTLRRLDATGETRTPDFRLERVRKGTGVLLTTKFHAIVDGTNGNTYLQPVDATLGHTHFVATGKVVRAEDLVPGAKGHDITLQVNIDRGRIEDILQIAADTDQPFMTGNLTLNTGFHLPPNPPSGDQPVFDRLALNGQFHLSQSRFNNASMQGKIADLSLRGQGKPDEVKTTDPNTILSDVRGHFTLGGGKLQLPDLVYQVPGAKILAHGTYGLEGGTLDFDGDADLEAEISSVVGGWKGILLKPVDHYLKKNGAGTDVPIHVKGTRKDPKFGVDFNRLGKTQKPLNQAPQ